MCKHDVVSSAAKAQVPQQRPSDHGFGVFLALFIGYSKKKGPRGCGPKGGESHDEIVKIRCLHLAV